MNKWPDYDAETGVEPAKLGVTYWCELDTMTRAGRFHATGRSTEDPRKAIKEAEASLRRKVERGLAVYDKRNKNR